VERLVSKEAPAPPPLPEPPLKESLLEITVLAVPKLVPYQRAILACATDLLALAWSSGAGVATSCANTCGPCPS